MNFGSNIIMVLQRYGHLFLKGTLITLAFSAVAVTGGVIFGGILALMRLSEFHITVKGKKIKPLSIISTAYVEVIRGTPILLQLYVFYFFIPSALSFLNLSKFASISLALIFNSAAYVAEIFRSGIDAVDHGQMEAARCLGLSRNQALMKIVLPQAIKNILPALCNEFVAMIKETSLASTFFAGDIMTTYKTVNGALFLVIEPLIIIAVIYFALTFTLSKVVAVFERRMKTSD